VLDKYEQTPGVVNGDVVDVRSSKLYDLIVGVSTLEHVRWDEEPRDSPKFLHGVERLTTFFAPDGKMLITLPVDCNAALDGFLKEGRASPLLRTCGVSARTTSGAKQGGRKSRMPRISMRDAGGMGVSPTALAW
jgi:hypothetical protein